MQGRLGGVGQRGQHGRWDAPTLYCHACHDDTGTKPFLTDMSEKKLSERKVCGGDPLGMWMTRDNVCVPVLLLCIFSLRKSS